MSRRRRKKSTVRAVTTIPLGGAVERVVALDNSSRACGWSVFDDGQLVAHSRYLQTGKGHGERLCAFRVWLLELFSEWQPAQVAYEAPYPGRMRNTFGILSRYVGIIESTHFEHFRYEVPLENVVAAHAVKRAIQAPRGKSHDDNKQIVLKLVNRQFRLRLRYQANDKTKAISQDDDADAIALNWAWHRLYREAGADE